MNTIRNSLFGLVAMAMATAAATPAAAVSFTYVGSWAVADGPLWSEPTTKSVSGQEAAALIFGGKASDYAISTAGPDVAAINFSAFLDGFDDIGFLSTPAAQDFVGRVGDSYSAAPGNYSAFVFDHACGRFYCTAGGGEAAINHAFRIVPDGGPGGGVPEPESWALLIAGFGLVGAVSRRRRSFASVTA